MPDNPSPLRLLASLVLDYFRWSQLTPMVLIWAFMLGALFLLFFVGHQEATWSLVDRVMAGIASLPIVGDRFVAWMQSNTQDGVFSPDLGQIDFKAATLTAWGVMSLVFMLVAWLAERLWGPFRPWSLKRKLGAALAACLAVALAFVLLYFLDREAWTDPLQKVLPVFGGMAFILFVISAWCLSISHAMGWLSNAVVRVDFAEAVGDPGLGADNTKTRA